MYKNVQLSDFILANKLNGNGLYFQLLLVRFSLSILMILINLFFTLILTLKTEAHIKIITLRILCLSFILKSLKAEKNWKEYCIALFHRLFLNKKKTAYTVYRYRFFVDNIIFKQSSSSAKSLTISSFSFLLVFYTV